jgi:hypothetical protein
MSRPIVIARVLAAAVCFSGIASTAGAQVPATPSRHPAVCAQGVRIYNDRAQLPAKRDSLVIPAPPGGQIRVSSPEEAEAAEMALRERAGSIGVTSLLILTETENDGPDMQRMRRSVAGFFIAADSVRAAGICKR